MRFFVIFLFLSMAVLATGKKGDRELMLQKNGSNHPWTIVSSSDDALRKVQVGVLNAYKPKAPKEWKCDLEDHERALQILNYTDQDDLGYAMTQLEHDLMHNQENVIIGAKSIQHLPFAFRANILIIWENVYINVLKYFNVLFGGYKIVNVSFGTPSPKSFFRFKNGGMLYYNLVSCSPLLEYLRVTRRISGIVYLVPRNHYVELRNRTRGVAALNRIDDSIFRTSEMDNTTGKTESSTELEIEERNVTESSY